MQDNLLELRDIHLPEGGVSIWPLGWGWWFILAVLVFCVVMFWAFCLLRRKSKKRYALKLLSELFIPNVGTLIKTSELLRRICVYKYPQASTYFGADWLQFLNEHCTQKLDGNAAQLFLNAPYISPSSNKVSQKEIEQIKSFCKQWIGENL